MACGQLQQTDAHLISLGCDHKVTFPEWRTSAECAPLDGDQDSAGAASAEVGAGADPANDQDPEADGGLNDGLAPTDPVAPPMSVGRRQPNEPTEIRETCAQSGTHSFCYWREVVTVREGTGARRSRRSSQQCVGPCNRWTVRVDTETVTSQGQTSTRACGTVPCDPRGTDAYLAKRCGEEVRCVFASASSDSGMARQTLCVVA